MTESWFNHWAVGGVNHWAVGGVNHWVMGGVNHWAVGGVNHWAVLRRIQTLQLVQTCPTYVRMYIRRG